MVSKGCSRSTSYGNSLKNRHLRSANGFGSSVARCCVNDRTKGLMMYKAYHNNEAAIFNTLSDLRRAFNLSALETARCFYPGVHHLSADLVVITFGS